MKIALVFSGQARAFKTSYDFYHKNLLKNYDVDVFFHTWTHPRVAPNELLELYKPKAYIFQNTPKDFSTVPLLHSKNQTLPRNIYLQFYSIYHSFRILEDHLRNTLSTYDFAIRSRFDYALNVELRFDILQPHYLYIPNCRVNAEATIMNDQFAISGIQNMLEYSRTYLRLPFIAGTRINPNAGESLLEANLRFLGMDGNAVKYVNMNYPFPPGKYNSTWHSLIRDDYELWASD